MEYTQNLINTDIFFRVAKIFIFKTLFLNHKMIFVKAHKKHFKNNAGLKICQH